MHNSVPSHSVCGTPFMDKLSLHVHRNAFYNVDCVFTTCDYMYGAIAPPSVANVSHECMHERDRHVHACAACCAPCLSSLWQRVPIPVLVQRCMHRAHCASSKHDGRAPTTNAPHRTTHKPTTDPPTKHKLVQFRICTVSGKSFFLFSSALFSFRTHTRVFTLYIATLRRAGGYEV